MAENLQPDPVSLVRNILDYILDIDSNRQTIQKDSFLNH